LIVLDRSSFNTNQNSFTRSVAQQKKKDWDIYIAHRIQVEFFSLQAPGKGIQADIVLGVYRGVKDFVRAKTKKITLFKRRFDANCLPLQPAHEQLSPPQKHPSSSICFCGNSAVWYHFKTRIADKETRQKIRKNKWQSFFLFFCAGENILLAQRAWQNRGDVRCSRYRPVGGCKSTMCATRKVEPIKSPQREKKILTERERQTNFRLKAWLKHPFCFLSENLCHAPSQAHYKNRQRQNNHPLT